MSDTNIPLFDESGDDLTAVRPLRQTKSESHRAGVEKTTPEAPVDSTLETGLSDSLRSWVVMAGTEPRHPAFALLHQEGSGDFDSEAWAEAARLLTAAYEASVQRSDPSDLFPLQARLHATPAGARAALALLKGGADEEPRRDATATEFALLGLLLHAPHASVRAVAAEALLSRTGAAVREILTSRAPFEKSKMVSALIRAGLAQSLSD